MKILLLIVLMTFCSVAAAWVDISENITKGEIPRFYQKYSFYNPFCLEQEPFKFSMNDTSSSKKIVCKKWALIATETEINELKSLIDKNKTLIDNLRKFNQKSIDSKLNKANSEFRERLVKKLKTLENDIALSEIFQLKVEQEVERRLKVESRKIEQRILKKLLSGESPPSLEKIN